MSPMSVLQLKGKMWVRAVITTDNIFARLRQNKKKGNNVICPAHPFTHTHARVGSLFPKAHYSSPTVTRFKFRFKFITKAHNTKYSFKRSCSGICELTVRTPTPVGEWIRCSVPDAFVPVIPSVC